jgi:RNA polymerase sigma-32 factor
MYVSTGHSLLKNYLLELRQHPLLSREKEHEIAVRFAETGERELADRLVTANLRLVVKIAFEYRTAHHSSLDLVQEGNAGLLTAVEKYDPCRGIKLSTYAAWWIRAFILKFIMSNSRLVKVGTTQAQRRLFFGLRKERARLERMGGTPVDAKKLAKALQVRESDVQEMEIRMSMSEASLDTPAKGDEAGARSYGDQLCAEDGWRPDEQSEAEEFSAVLSTQLAAFAKTLVARDLEIFRRRFVSENAATLSVLGVKFGISRERVRQLEQRLKDKLRRHLQLAMGDALPG